MIQEYIPIADFCLTGSGTTPSRQKASEYYGGKIPWVKSGELRESVIWQTEESITEAALSETSLKLVPAGSLLVAMYGATVGRVGRLGIDATTNQAICHILPDEARANADYIFHALKNKAQELISRGVGGAQPNISQGVIKETKIFLPSLEEQHRIAAVLDKADAIRRKREQALSLADDLLKSAFLEKFGDPVRNPRDWKLGKIGDCLIDSVGGWSAKGDSRPANADEMGVLKISAVTSGEYRPSENKFVASIPEDRKLVIPQLGDLLFSRANTRELVAATCIVVDAPQNVFLPDKLWRLDVDPKVAVGLYLKFVLGHQEYRNLLCSRAIGTSGSMLNISKAKLYAHPIPIPPLDAQLYFAEFWNAVSSVKAKLSAAFWESESSFSSLSQRAFRGEL